MNWTIGLWDKTTKFFIETATTATVSGEEIFKPSKKVFHKLELIICSIWLEVSSGRYGSPQSRQ